MKHPLIFIAATAALSFGCAGQNEPNYGTLPRMPDSMQTWSNQIAAWPPPAQKAAREMGQKYGSPDEVTDTQLVWHERGPWKRSILSRDGTPHDWPEPHVDVLEQVIDFRVDPSRVDEIAKFDGSVIVERTKGELSARCGGEAANFLAINLARDIATGKRTAENARTFYEQAMAEASAGEKPEAMKRLMFAEAEKATADPDKRAQRPKPKGRPAAQNTKGSAATDSND